MSDLTISVITVAFNSENTILKTIESVNDQSYSNIQHVFIDGLSTDSTINIINNFSTSKNLIISEKDNGIYDAMNKGIMQSSGEIVAFLNSDDFYADARVIEDVVNLFNRQSVDFVYGDVDMIGRDGKILRHWHVGESCKSKLNGRQIPHPSFFLRRDILIELNPPFDSRYKIAADFKQQLILINQKGIKGEYLSRSLVKMKIGGASTNGFFAYLHGWIEAISAYNEVFGSGGFIFVSRKVFVKLKIFEPKNLIELLFNSK